MKTAEREAARKLRRAGHSMREIAGQINCAKSSISRWLQDIPLRPQQIERLNSNQDRGRAKAANHPNSPKMVWAKIRNETMQMASRELPLRCSMEMLKISGACLYWAEGYRASFNMVNFSNSDPSMIRFMMAFFRRVCRVPPAKFRGVVHIHPHLNSNAACKYWSQISGIPLNQFHRTQFAISRSSRQKRDSLPRGTFRIVISDTHLQCRIRGWIEGMQRWANSSVG